MTSSEAAPVRVWLLFVSDGDGKAAPLVEVAPPAFGVREKRLELWLDGPGDTGFRDAGERGARLAYEMLWSEQLISQSIDLEFGLQAEGSWILQGNSAELGFALACVVSTLAHLDGRVFASVAATGCLDEDGVVRRVEGIAAKVEAALAVLPVQGLLIYPEENDRELTRDLRLRARQRAVELRPVQRLDEAIEALSVPVAKIYLDSPFRGLEAFEYRHRSIFYGRRSEAEAVVNWLLEREGAGKPGVLVVGASGSGKSSFMQAGVLPELERWARREKRGLNWALWRPREASALKTHDHLAQSVCDAWRAVAELAGLAAPADLDELGAAFLRHWPTDRLFVWVIDQLEELFTLNFTAEQIARLITFVHILQAHGVWVLATMRSDFYPHFLNQGDLGAIFSGKGIFNLRRLDGENLEQVIHGPTAAAGYRFETNAEGASLGTRLLKDALQAEDPLPLLQFTLTELFRRRNSATKSLTWNAYGAIGGLTGAIAALAETRFGKLDPSTQAALPRLLRKLVVFGEGDTPNACPAVRAELCRDAPTKELIDAFLAPDARLLMLEHEGTQVRVAHEALFSSWGTARECIEKNKEDIRLEKRLQEEAAQWIKNGKRFDFLIPEGLRLIQAKALLSRLPDGAGAGEEPEFVEFIGASLNERERQRLGDLSRPAREVLHNMPAERDSFIGRSQELSTLASRLEAGVRLLTVVGAGGAGKTRLVQRYGWTWMCNWPGGVFFCDLSECRSLDGIFFAMASALEVPLGSDPAVQLGHAMAGRGRCLIILDNFEQVVEHAGATVGRWLDRVGSATFVVTSRERLHLGGEVLLPLDPLPVATESVDLFCVRAIAQRPDFALTEVNQAAVAEIVRLLDGLPLAIELAAARIAVLPPAQLLGRLRDRFRILAGAHGTAARQATLRNTIDWSWSLLTPWEQTALAQCSVFDGGFTLVAAEAVLDLGDHLRTAPPVLDVVQALVDKSLLRTLVPVEDRRYDLDGPYFTIYVSIREYAREKLRASGADVERAAEDRHGEYFASFGTDDYIEALSRHMGASRRRSLTLEIDNLVAACHRGIARGHAGTAVATYRAAWEVLELQGPVTLAATLGRELLASLGLSDRLGLVALTTVALPLQRAGRMDEARNCLEKALLLSRQLSDRRWEGRILGQLGTLHLDQGRIEQARHDLDTALALNRAALDRRAEGAVLSNLGNLYFDQGLMTEARQHYEAALVVSAEIGNRRAEGSVLGNLALLHFEQGRVEEALAAYGAALAIHREVGSRRLEGTVLGNLGLLRFERGELDEAKAQDEAALAIHRAVGNRRDEGIVLGNLGEVHFATGSWQDADDCYRGALAIAREVGYRRAEGGVLGSLGELLATQGRIEEAREALRAGDGVLRELNDRLGLGKLLCVRVRVEFAEGKVDTARSALVEAESLAVVTSAGPESELGSEIAKLRKLLT